MLPSQDGMFRSCTLRQVASNNHTIVTPSDSLVHSHACERSFLPLKKHFSLPHISLSIINSFREPAVGSLLSSPRMATHRLVCLRCRGSGHLVVDCKVDSWWPELSWMFEERRMAMDFKAAWQNLGRDEYICQRCRNLDLIALLRWYPLWTTQAELEKAFNDTS